MQGECREDPEPPKAQLDRDFTQLVTAQRDRLYRFILKNIGNPTDAEDLAQQTFMEAYKSLASFRGESEQSTWLLGIAMNLVRNYLARSPHRRYQMVPEDTITDVPCERQTPVEDVSYSEAVIALKREMEILAEPLREVLLLVAVEGISYEDAAAMLAIPVGTVRSRLSRARATLRQRLPGIVDLIQET